MTDFMNYFPDRVEYPDVCSIRMEGGVYHEYISSTFLDGWVNYVTFLDAVMITRYTESDDAKDQKESEEALEKFRTAPDFHTKIYEAFHDDVLILATPDKAKSKDDAYWFFWYDGDCSDCCIGRFNTEDTLDDVKSSFRKFAEAVSYGPVHDLPVKNFKGWIKGN